MSSLTSRSVDESVSSAEVPSASHTPGPWQFTATDPAEGGEWFWITATPASNQEIGTVSGPQNARNTANARLIAAAPDLLEALKAAVNRVQFFLDTFGDVGDCVTQADIGDWEAAISRASAEG